MSTYEDWEAEADYIKFVRAQTREEWEANEMASRMWSNFKLNGQLVHIQIGVKSDYLKEDYVGSNIVLVLPFIRGVTQIRETHRSSYDRRLGFKVHMGNGEPIDITSSMLELCGEIDPDVRAKAMRVMVDIRHKLLEAINEYNTRPYIGEQFKLQL